jgi:Tol biopolymer transport system component
MALAASFGLVGPASRAEAAFSGPNGRIAFVRFTFETDPEVFTIDADGSNRVRLTRNGSGDTSPAWSSDGRWLAWECHVGNGQVTGEVCVMRPDGSGKRQLTSGPAGHRYPSWSPDGRRLVYVRVIDVGTQEQPDIRYDLFTMRRDGTGHTRLTTDRLFKQHPQWANDGSRIAYAVSTGADSDSAYDILTVTPSGERIRNLTNTPGVYESSPSWSPGSGSIAFTRFVDSATVATDAPGWQIFRMKRDGTGERQLTSGDAGSDLGPAWSPDGKGITFAREDDLFRMKADGTRERRVTGETASSKTFDASPNWGPAR